MPLCPTGVSDRLLIWAAVPGPAVCLVGPVQEGTDLLLELRKGRLGPPRAVWE